MLQFNSFDEKRHTAIYVRISTASQKTDRQQEELTSYAELNQLNFNRNLRKFILGKCNVLSNTPSATVRRMLW